MGKIIMGIKNWLLNQISALSLAFSNVEKDLLGQDTKENTTGNNHVQRHQLGTLVDSLKHGIITEDVKNLRWRMYKSLKNIDKHKLILKEDESGNIEYSYKTVDYKSALSKVKLDDVDNNELEMVLDNRPITGGVVDILDNIEINDSMVVSSNDLHIANKNERSLTILRDFYPKFYLENYTIKVNIRTINDKRKLIEFYINKYSDQFDLKSKTFINEVQKLIENQNLIGLNTFDIKTIGFITNNTLGADDFLYYEYEILSFDKAIEFDGYYVIKYIGDVSIDGNDTLAEYVQSELDVKYKNKELRNKRP